MATAPSAAHVNDQIRDANATGRTPVVFIHGLWLLPSSWQPWADVFGEAGFAPVLAPWPDDPDTVEEANAHPEQMAKKTVGQVADSIGALIAQLDRKPAIVGHSFGGLMTQILAGRGLSVASVAISPAPFRGVLPLPISTLRSSFPILGNPANYAKAVPLTFEQFHYAFANATSEDEAKALYNAYAVPATGAALFQAATANLNPWTEVKVNSKNPERGPLLIVAGGEDHTVPPVVSKAAYKKQSKNEGVTELATVEGHGHALTIDSGWRAVCDLSLEFIQRFAT